MHAHGNVDANAGVSLQKVLSKEIMSQVQKGFLVSGYYPDETMQQSWCIAILGCNCLQGACQHSHFFMYRDRVKALNLVF